MILSVIDYGLSLTTLSQSNLLKLDRMQNDAMRIILGTTKDTPIETMRYLLDLPSVDTRHTVEQAKVYLTAMRNPKNPLPNAVKEEKDPTTTVNPACVRPNRAQANKGLGKKSNCVKALLRDSAAIST